MVIKPKSESNKRSKLANVGKEGRTKRQKDSDRSRTVQGLMKREKRMRRI